MITWMLTTYYQTQFQLPAPVSASLTYSIDAACDSFSLIAPIEEGGEQVLKDATRLTAYFQNEIVFHGVVDECEFSLSYAGRLLEIHGRGMQALLLDNEASSVDFGTATLADILKRYVMPYGISLQEEARLSAVSRFSVQMGSSCWAVLEQFARFHGKMTPRFNKKGELVLSPLPSDVSLHIDDETPISKLLWRYKRFGVLSQISVINRVSYHTNRLQEQEVLEKGICRSRVLTVPKTTPSHSARYNGAFQLEQSRKHLHCVELSTPQALFVETGELISLQQSNWCDNGIYRVIDCGITLGKQV